MATDLHVAIRETWARALEEERVVEVPAVAHRVIRDFPELVAPEQDRLIFLSIQREIKQIARQEAEDSSQLTLFGFPSVIAIPVPDDGYHYMQSTKAIWDDLTAGAQVREVNVRRAQQKLDTYNGALAHVRPLMEGTDLTLAQALERLQDAA
jgi:hypothetical protein